MFGPPRCKSLPAPSTRVTRQAKQMSLDEMQHRMMKSKTDKINITPRRNGGPDPTNPKGSNVVAESTDASPSSDGTPSSPAPAERATKEQSHREDALDPAPSPTPTPTPTPAPSPSPGPSRAAESDGPFAGADEHENTSGLDALPRGSIVIREDADAGSTADQHGDSPATRVATREATHSPTIKVLWVRSAEEGRICLGGSADQAGRYD